MILTSDTPAGIPVVTPQMAAAFDRLALIARSADPELAVAAMDADLLLRASLPTGAVETTALTALPGPSTTDPGLAAEAVKLLDRHADLSESAAAVLADAAATERLMGVLWDRPAARMLVDGWIAQGSAWLAAAHHVAGRTAVESESDHDADGAHRNRCRRVQRGPRRGVGTGPRRLQLRHGDGPAQSQYGRGY